MSSVGSTAIMTVRAFGLYRARYCGIRVPDLTWNRKQKATRNQVPSRLLSKEIRLS